MCGEGREIPSTLPTLFVAASSDCSKLDYDNVNNEKVGSGPNLEDTSLEDAPRIGWCGWQGKECDHQDYDKTFVVRG
jgi:hypothetical protein